MTSLRPPSRAVTTLLSLLVAALLLRPWDQIPALAAIRPVSTLIAGLAIVWALDKPRIRWFVDPPSKPLWGLLTVAAATTPFSYWPANSVQISFQILQQVILFTIITNVASSVGDMSRLARIIVVCCAFHGGLAAVKYLSGQFGADQRVFGIGLGAFSDPNDLALSLVMAFPLAWWSLQPPAGRSQQAIALLAILAMIAGVLATQSRGGLMALGAAFFMMARRSSNSRMLFLIVSCLGLALAVFVFPAAVFERYASIVHYQSDESATVRLAVWRAGASMFLDHPITGVGAGAFEVAYGAGYLDQQGAGNVWRAAHSSYVQVAAELGVFGLTAWLAMIASGFVTLGRARRALRAGGIGEAQLAMFIQSINALEASLAGYVVGAMFLSRAYDLLLVIILALGAVAWRLIQAAQGEMTSAAHEIAPTLDPT